jgi:hypothetical protein
MASRRRLPRRRADQIGHGPIVEAHCAVQPQCAGAQHLPDPAEGENRTGDGGRPLDEWHAGGWRRSIRGDRRGARDLQPFGLTDSRFHRPMPPIDESYQQTLMSDYQSIRAGLRLRVSQPEIVVGATALHRPLESRNAEHDDVIQTLASRGADEPFGIRVLPG